MLILDLLTEVGIEVVVCSHNGVETDTGNKSLIENYTSIGTEMVQSQEQVRAAEKHFSFEVCVKKC